MRKTLSKTTYMDFFNRTRLFNIKLGSYHSPLSPIPYKTVALNKQYPIQTAGILLYFQNTVADVKFYVEFSMRSAKALCFLLR